MSNPTYRVTEATIADLKGAPEGKNARRHNPRNIGMIADSMNEVGAARSVVIDENNDMLAGSGSLEGAAQAGIERVLIVDTDGETLVAVRRSGLTEEQKVHLAIADNRAAELAEWDPTVMTELFADGTLQPFFTDEEAEALMVSFVAHQDKPTEGQGGDDFEPEIKPPLQAITRPGNLYAIGDHRLLCWDCTDPEAADVLFFHGERQAQVVWTDPPYGVAIGDKNKYLNTIKKSNRVEENLEGDTLDEEALYQLLAESFPIALDHQAPGGAWYVTGPGGPLGIIWSRILSELGIWRQTITWVKNNATFAPLGQDYHWRSEPMYYGWKPGGAHRYYGGRSQDTVWEIDRPLKSPEHPTMKPIELVQRSVENSSLRGEIVYDPFAGSGSTLIACHRASRVAFMMEKDPIYCDVVLARAAAEGIGPIRLISDNAVLSNLVKEA